MLQEELDLKKAIEKWLSGRNVMAAFMTDPDSDGRMQVIPIDLLFRGVRFLVDVPAVQKTEPDCEVAREDDLTEQDPEETADPPKHSRQTKPKKLDIGKIMALRDAGWTNQQIADEMGTTKESIASTVYAHKKKNGQ